MTLPGGPECRTPQPLALPRRSVGSIQRDQPFISPSARRVSSVTSPVVELTRIDNDEAELKNRRRSRVLQRQQLNSPSSTTATPTDKRANTGPLNNHQLADHYANCLKLSVENKINAKNAFGLHLIDYMSDLLNKKEATNFQVAGSTLDASAKIYAGRVDAIHSETYKVLTGLGRSSDKPGNDDGEEVTADDLANGDDPDGPPGAKKRKQVKRGKTIETNLKNINLHKVDVAFETDPLFHKTSAAFDEGGTAGLLLNHLSCRDDSCELILDSNTVVSDLNETLTNPEDVPVMKPAAVKELKEMFLSLNLDGTQICPEFSDFEFMSWSSDQEPVANSLLSQTVGKSSHAFDLEAEAESIPETTESEPEAVDDYPDDGFGPLQDHNNDDDNALADKTSLSGQSFMLGDPKSKLQAMNSIKRGTVDKLMQVLSSEPSDYSYFEKDILQTWAGPSHWKLCGKSKAGLCPAPSEENKPKDKNKKKEAFVVDYDQEIDFTKDFRETRATTRLKQATLDKKDKSQNVLVEDLHYDPKKLSKSCKMPRIMVRKLKRKSTSQVDEQVGNYDYDNSMDKDNFCPGNDLADHHDDDDNDHEGGFDFMGGTSQFVPSQDLPDDDAEEGALTGDNLVAAPRKVAKIDIAYAKYAKKMDVKRLKHSIWNLLKTPEVNSEPAEDNAETSTEDKTETAEDEPAEKDSKSAEKEDSEPSTSDSVAGAHTFKALIRDLPGKVSKNMAKNLSVPIAFICLLHLANEKTLDLQSLEDMTDIVINQG